MVRFVDLNCYLGLFDSSTVMKLSREKPLLFLKSSANRFCSGVWLFWFIVILVVI